MTSFSINGEQAERWGSLHFCTSLGLNNAPKLIALYWSLLRHSRRPFVFWILCDGDEVYKLLSKLNLENARLIALSEFEKADLELLSVKSDRDIFEYNCTLRPCWILYLLNAHPEIEFLTYMDTDLYFFSDPQSLYVQMRNSSILLSEHRFSRLATKLGMDPAISGTYNAGWLAIKNDSQGKTALRWWRERCLEWCRRYYEDGKFGEQKYLDDWHTRFPGAVALSAQGGNVAPWNIGDLDLSVDQIGQVHVNKELLVFYHFHALQMSGESSFKVVEEVGQGVIQLTNPSYVLKPKQVKYIYRPYTAELEKAINLVKSLQPLNEVRIGNKVAKQSSLFTRYKAKIKRKLIYMRSLYLSL